MTRYEKVFKYIYYSNFTINGLTDPNATLGDLLNARAEAGRSLLIELGVNDKKRLKISNSHIYDRGSVLDQCQQV